MQQELLVAHLHRARSLLAIVLTVRVLSVEPSLKPRVPRVRQIRIRNTQSQRPPSSIIKQPKHQLTKSLANPDPRLGVCGSHHQVLSRPADRARLGIWEGWSVSFGHSPSQDQELFWAAFGAYFGGPSFCFASASFGRPGEPQLSLPLGQVPLVVADAG